MDPHPRQPHGSAFELFVSLDEYRRPANSTQPPVSLRDPQTPLVLVSWFSLDHGHAARSAVRSLALAAKLDSSGAPIRRPPDGFADPRHRTASGHAAPHSAPLPGLVSRRPGRRPAYGFLLRSPISPLPLLQVVPRTAPLWRWLRLRSFRRMQYNVVAHCPSSLDDMHNGVRGGCQCTTRSAYDHTAGNATDRPAKQHRLARRPMARSREHFPRSLVEFADIAPNSRSPHGRSEARPATALSVCVECRGEVRRFHSAVCVLFFRRHKHRRKPGWSELGRSLRRKGVSSRSPLAGCTQEIADRAPETIAKSDEPYRVREICEIPTRRLPEHGGPDPFPNVVLRLSSNRLARSPAVRLAVLFRAALRPNAGATSPVRIRSNYPSAPTVSDRCFVAGYRWSLGRPRACPRSGTLPPTVATPGCCVQSEIPPERPRLPPCPNTLPLPCVRSPHA